jgi:chemotaxis signal transduction protein
VSEREPRAGPRAAELGRAFDLTFAEPVRTASDDRENLLGLRAGGDPYAVRLGEIAGLLRGLTIVPVPGPLPELLGVVGLRGGIVPIYSLRALLGYPPAAETPAWIALAGGDTGIGLGFDQFEGYLRVARSEISARAAEASRTHIGESVRVASALRGLISVPSLVSAIKARVGGVTRKETSHVDVR